MFRKNERGYSYLILRIIIVLCVSVFEWSDSAPWLKSADVRSVPRLTNITNFKLTNREINENTPFFALGNFQQTWQPRQGTNKQRFSRSDKAVFRKTCTTKLALNNVRLKNGRKLARFKRSGVVKSMDACVGLCCADNECDVAFIMDKYCYLVSCPSVKACVPIISRNSKIKTSYAFLDKPKNEKRTVIPEMPNSVKVAKQLTIKINVTNEKFTPELASDESLEFLNLAERLENAVSLVLKNTLGFLECEVQSFSQGPLVANITLKFTNESVLNESVSALLSVIKQGRMDSTLEDAKEHFKLSPQGTQFKTMTGQSLVCRGEDNYESSWTMTVFGASDRQPCPRNARGDCFRACLGGENATVFWDLPDFSGCTSTEFNNLHNMAKVFKTEAAAKVPLDQIEAKARMTSVDIFQKLQTLTYQHTFREHIIRQRKQTNKNETEQISKETEKQLATNKTFLDHRPRRPELGNPKKEPGYLGDISKILQSINNIEHLKTPVVNKPTNFHYPKKPSSEPNREYPSPGQEVNSIKPITNNPVVQSSLNNIKLPWHESASQGAYHVLHDTTQNTTNVVQQQSQQQPQKQQPQQRQQQRYTKSNQTLKEPISVSVSLSGDFDGLDPTITNQPTGIFVKSKPETIRSRIPYPGLPQIQTNNRYSNIPGYQPQNQMIHNQSPLMYGRASTGIGAYERRPNGPGLYNQQRIKYPNSYTQFGLSRAKRQNSEWDNSYYNSLQPMRNPANSYSVKQPGDPLDSFFSNANTKTNNRNENRYFDDNARREGNDIEQRYKTQRTDEQDKRNPNQNSEKHDTYFVGFDDQTRNSQTSGEKKTSLPNYQPDYLSQSVYTPYYSTPPPPSYRYDQRLTSESSSSLHPTASQSPTPSPTTQSQAYYVPLATQPRTTEPPLNEQEYSEHSNVPTKPPTTQPPSTEQPTPPQTTQPSENSYQYSQQFTDPQSYHPPSTPSPPTERSPTVPQFFKPQLESPPPYIAPRQPPPTTSSVTQPPTTSSVTPPPTTSSVTQPPTTSSVTPPPTTSSVTQPPTTSMYSLTPPPPTPPTPLYYPPPTTPAVSPSSSDTATQTNSSAFTPAVHQPSRIYSEYTQAVSPPTTKPTSTPLEYYNNTFPSFLAPTENFTHASNNSATDFLRLQNATLSQTNQKSSLVTYESYSQAGSNQSNTMDGNESTAIQEPSSVSPHSAYSSQSNTTKYLDYTVPGTNILENLVKNLSKSDYGSLNNQLSDYNVTTYPLPTAKMKDDLKWSNDFKDDYNITFEKLAENMTADIGQNSSTAGWQRLNKTRDSQGTTAVEKPYYTIGDAREMIGHSNQTDETMQTKLNLTEGQHVAPMFGGDLLLVADTIKNLVKFNDYIRPDMTLADIKAFLSACSNILDISNAREWEHAQKKLSKLQQNGVNIMNDGNSVDWELASKRTTSEPAKSPQSPSTLFEMVEAIEAFGLSASYQVKKPPIGPIITQNIVMELRSISTNIQEPAPNIVFPNTTDPVIQRWSNETTNSISLSPAALDEIAQGPNVEVHVSGILFKTIGDLSIPVEGASGNGTITSGNLLSMSVFPKITGNLDPPIKIALAHTNAEMSKFKQSCVFLDTAASDGSVWSEKGCKVVDVNETHTTCVCDHMSSFSVLVDKSQLNTFKAHHAKKFGGGHGGGSGGGGGSFLVKLLVLILLVILLIVIILIVWRKFKRKQNSGDGDDSSKSRDEGINTTSRTTTNTTTTTTTEGTFGQSSHTTSSQSSERKRRDDRKKKREDGKQRRKKKRKPKEEIIDKDEQGTPNEESALPKKEHEDELLMKEKAMIFADYRQPYNFLSHEDPAPVDSSTPLPATTATPKADSYPRRYRRAAPDSGDAPFGLRKHYSESNFPLTQQRARGSSPGKGSTLGLAPGHSRAGAIWEEPLEEVNEDPGVPPTPQGSQRPSVSESVGQRVRNEEQRRRRFWKRKAKEAVSTRESESPKKRIFGRKAQSSSGLSLSAEEQGGATGELQSPSKKKRFWKRKKDLKSTEIGSSDEGISADDRLTGNPEAQQRSRGGSLLQRLSGSKTSLNKSEQTIEQVSPTAEKSPKKRRPSVLSRLSRSRESLSKSEESIERLSPTTEKSRKKRRPSVLSRLSRSRDSLNKSEDSLENLANTGQAPTDKRKSSMLRKLSKSNRSSRTPDPQSIVGTEPEAAEQKTSRKSSFLGRISRSGSKTSLGTSEEYLDRTSQRQKTSF